MKTEQKNDHAEQTHIAAIENLIQKKKFLTWENVTNSMIDKAREELTDDIISIFGKTQKIKEHNIIEYGLNHFNIQIYEDWRVNLLEYFRKIPDSVGRIILSFVLHDEKLQLQVPQQSSSYKCGNVL